MRIFVALLVVLSVLYFWDREYNHGKLLDGLDSMRRAIAHSMLTTVARTGFHGVSAEPFRGLKTNAERGGLSH